MYTGASQGRVIFEKRILIAFVPLCSCSQTAYVIQQLVFEVTKSSNRVAVDIQQAVSGRQHEQVLLLLLLLLLPLGEEQLLI